MDLVQENRQVLNLVQAMAGLISDRIRAITLKCDDTGVVLRFFLFDEDEEVAEDVRSIVFEFEALQESGIDVYTKIEVREDETLNLLDMGRVVFARK